MSKVRRTYEILDYEVWGNEEDGFDVNNVIRSGIFITLPDDCTDRQIVGALKKVGWMKQDIPVSDVDIEGESGYSLYVTHAPSGEPACELRVVDKDRKK